MPRGRMLNKTISVDEEVAKLSDKAIILYSWCIPHLDSEGKMLASNEILKGIVVPYLKSFSLSLITRAKKELAESGLVVVYGENGKYMKFNGFEKNQTINKDREAPSEIPNPTQDELQSKSGLTPLEYKYKSNINISKDKYKAEIVEFFEYYLLKTKKNFTLNSTRRAIIESRLEEGKTLDQLKQAVDNFVQDDWKDRGKHLELVYCIGIRNKVDNLEKWINTKPKEEPKGIERFLRKD